MKAKPTQGEPPAIAIDASFGPVRLALVEAGRLVDYYEDWPESGRLKGNLYRGVIRKVDARLDAAFVRFGAEKDGFLPAKDLDGLSETPPKAGDAILVQVVKDPVAAKGAVLTTRLSYSGRGLVFMPLKEGAGGVSTRLEGEEREQLRGVLKKLRIPEGGSVILRTAALGKSQAELQADLDRLALAHREASDFCARRKEPGLVAREAPPAIRYLREYLRPGIETIWVSDEAVGLVSALRLSPDGPQLFEKLGLESQIEALSQRKVGLPCGANIVIDAAEALVAVDVNSGGLRAKKASAKTSATSEPPAPDPETALSAEGGLEPALEVETSVEGAAQTGRGKERAVSEEHEATALLVNLEAAEEVARQLRLRDLGGIIVVDFIDMESGKNRERVEQALRRALARDKAKIRVYPISPLGTLELSRQRLRKSSESQAGSACEACGGSGRLESVEGRALTLLRAVDARSRQKKSPAGLLLRAPWPVANEVWGKYRSVFFELERRFRAGLQLQALPDRQAPFQILEVALAPAARTPVSPPVSEPKNSGVAVDAVPQAPPSPSKPAAGGESPPSRHKQRRGFRAEAKPTGQPATDPIDKGGLAPVASGETVPERKNRSRRRRSKPDRSRSASSQAGEGRDAAAAADKPPTPVLSETPGTKPEAPATSGASASERTGRRRRRRSPRKKKDS